MNDGQVETNRLYAWIAKDLQGIEGIIAAPTDYGFLPLIVSDRQTALSFAPAAKEAARARGSQALLVEFLRGETLAVEDC